MPRGHVLPEGSAIASLRGEAGLTQDQLAERAGYGLRTIGKIEGGHRTTAQTLAAIATVLGECLGRPISAAELLRARHQRGVTPRSASSAAVVAENVQWLEFSAGTKDGTAVAAPLRAVLTDTACVRQTSTSAGELSFYYIADDAVIEAASLSHPQTAVWQATDAVRDHEFAIDEAAPCHVLRVAVPAGQDERTIVQNRIVFAGADALLEKKQYRTVVAYPTESLTVLVRFPAEQPYRALRGSFRRQAEGMLETTADQPINITAGRLAYWRVVSPLPGTTYQLDWS